MPHKNKENKMPDIKDMEGPVKFKKGVELYFDPKKDMFYDPKKKKYVSEKDILALEEVELTEKISCGCGPDCDHCQGKHSESEVGKKCECCGNEIIKESNSDSKNDRKLEEELLEKSEEYQKFFQSALKKFGVDSPAELDDKKKKEFFDYVDKNWKGENEKEESIEERYDRKTTLKLYRAMMKKYGDDPYYKQVLDALFKDASAMEKAIKSLIAIRGNQAFINLQSDMKRMVGEELKIEEAISEKLGPVIVISYNTNGKPYTTVIRKEENIEESRIRLSSLMNGSALLYDRDEDPDDDKLATVKVKGNPKKDIKNGDDLVLSLMGKGKSKEKEILKSLKKYYPKSKVVKEESELSDKMQKYVDACGKDFTTYSLKEGKKDYEIYHKTFTSAVEEVEKFAEKNGYEIDSDEMFNKVGTGPKKPSVGKTNEYHLTLMKNGKEDRKKLHFQVHGMKTQYELNMYIS